MKNALSLLKNQRGIALLVSIFALTLMIFIAVEVGYDTSIEYVVARQQVNRLKSYYAAKAGVEISLLRIVLYKKAVAAFGEQLGDNLSMLDPIWQMPFSWPPMVPDSVSTADKSTIDDVVKSSSMDSQFVATIESEGGKLDLNDLGAASKQVQEATKQQVLKIFLSEVEHNEKFAEKYRNFKFEELVNNMIDWMDEDSESLNGGGESDQYRDIRNDMIPPNQPFKTIKELNMVAQMNEEFFRLLESRATIFGTKGVNVNYAPREVIGALDPTMKEDALNAIIKRRSDQQEGGPYKNEDDFLGYAGKFGVNTQAIHKSGIPLVFGSEFNFRIRSTGRYGNVKRDITAITFDLENVRDRYTRMVDKEELAKQPAESGSSSGGGAAPPPSAPPAAEKEKINPPKGRPTVVYWEET